MSRFAIVSSFRPCASIPAATACRPIGIWSIWATAPWVVQAEHILRTGQDDAVFMAWELLCDPYWPLHAGTPLRVDVEWPPQ